MTIDEEWSAMQRQDAELITELREAWTILIDNSFHLFCGGSAGPCNSAKYTIERAEKVLGKDMVDHIRDQELDRFGSHHDPEVWRIFTTGTEEEAAALEDKWAQERLNREVEKLLNS